MRVIPNVLHGNISTAEHKVFNLLRELDLGLGWIAYHSLNVSEHQRKQWSELDFVIVGPRGIFILEIKGGRVKCVDGIWYFTDKHDQTHKKSEGPFQQAATGMYALRDKFKKDNIADLQRQIQMGWGVVFPDIVFSVPSPEMPKEVICDERNSKSSEVFKRYLMRLIHYWNDKGKQFTPLSQNDELLTVIEKYLRPNFDVSPSLNNQVDVLYQEIVRHTEEQYNYFDSIELHDQIICSGGAGTGKSFLAVETARREIYAGNTVLLVAMHEVFTAYLSAQFEDKLLKICSFSMLKKNIETFADQKFDVLIVDEGQDLMVMENIDVFDRVLIKGIEHGRWRFFMDENYQAGVVGVFDEDALSFLKSSGAVYQRLKHNCRNTQQIVYETESTTGANIGETQIKGDGPPVHYYQVLSKDDEADKLVRHIELLYQDGVELSEMVILSPVKIGLSVVSKIPIKWKKRIDVISKHNVMNPSPGFILFSLISDFKGLERKYVMLVDTEVLDDRKHSLSLLYIAMSRSNAGLWISVGDKFQKNLLGFQKRNLLNRE